jgi:hypothetical protein
MAAFSLQVCNVAWFRFSSCCWCQDHESKTGRVGSITPTIHARVETSSQDVFSHRGTAVASNVRGHQHLVCDLFVMRRNIGRGNRGLYDFPPTYFNRFSLIPHRNTYNFKTKIFKDKKRVSEIFQPRLKKNRRVNLIFIEGGMDQGGINGSKWNIFDIQCLWF